MQNSTIIKPFAGTATRLIAYILDLIILNIIFLVIYLLLKITGYSYIDYWLIFIIIYLFYFGLGDSILFNGQTIGKRARKIQVVTESGNPAGAGIALGRAFYVSLLYFNYNIINIITELLEPFHPGWFLFLSLSFTASFLLFSTTVFTAFNPFYQGMHDVITKTLVIKQGQYESENKDKYFNMSRIMAGYFVTVVLTLICVVISIVVKILTRTLV
ncbi:MAG: RDD family protein [Cyanobacteriota bacterium]